MKKFIIIIFVLIIVAGLLWMFVFKNDGLNISNVNETTSPTESVSDTPSTTATSTKILEAAADNELYTTAVNDKNPDSCEGIEDNAAKNRCFSRVATDLGQTDICQEIDDSLARQECLDSLTFQTAVDSSNISLCSAVIDDFWKGSCLSQILKKNSNDISVCEVLDSDDKKRCQALAAFKQAESSGECSELTDEGLREECEQAQVEYIPVEEQPAPVVEEEETISVDSDNDGLTDEEEINIYNTDPNNPDTDGDSYLDGQEVENGYDPLS